MHQVESNGVAILNEVEPAAKVLRISEEARYHKLCAVRIGLDRNDIIIEPAKDGRSNGEFCSVSISRIIAGEGSISSYKSISTISLFDYRSDEFRIYCAEAQGNCIYVCLMKRGK